MGARRSDALAAVKATLLAARMSRKVYFVSLACFPPYFPVAALTFRLLTARRLNCVFPARRVSASGSLINRLNNLIFFFFFTSTF